MHNLVCSTKDERFQNDHHWTVFWIKILICNHQLHRNGRRFIGTIQHFDMDSLIPESNAVSLGSFFVLLSSHLHIDSKYKCLIVDFLLII